MIEEYNGVIIRQFDPEMDSISELTSLLNHCYKSLADMGFQYLTARQDESITLNRIKGAYCLIGVKDDKIVASISYYPSERAKGCAWYEKEGVGKFGQFGVEPGLQRNGLGSKLIDIVENYARENGAKEIALDTAEGATHLIESYKKRGYRFIEYANWDVTNYRSVIMSKKL